MKVLVLGGTGFLGPEIVQALLDRKHTVTLFNRGRTHKELFPDLERLIGDRAKDDLAALEGRTWDVCIDVFASQPKWVKATCEKLAKSCKVYAFVSTISVFDDFSKPDIGENGHTFENDPKMDELDRVTNEAYGSMKVRSEHHVRSYFPETATIVRPGLIVGPGDTSDRFTYWPVRIDHGGEVLAPGEGKDAVQFVDVRDLGNFVAQLIDEGHVGTYNATGPAGELSLAELLHGCKAATANDVRFTWVDEKWLLEHGVQPFGDLPMWAPGAEMAGFMRINCTKAKAHGLTFRPLAETARDTIAWAKKRPADYKTQAGWDLTREADVLSKWKLRKEKQ
jgi:2'-hydroxyisoflavone reductase